MKIHRSSILWWLIPAAAITVLMYKFAAHRQPATSQFTEVTCILPDGTLLPINQDSASIGELYGKVPAKMIDTSRDVNLTMRIEVPARCRFKLLFNSYSVVYLNEKSTFYVPLNADIYHTMGIKGEAFFIFQEEDTSSFYRIAAGSYAAVGCGQGRLYVRTTGDSCTVAMLTAHGQINTSVGGFPHVGPMQGVHMAKGVIPQNWSCGYIDSTFVPPFAIAAIWFTNKPFGEVARFLEHFYQMEVVVENEYLNFQPVTLEIHPRMLSLESTCEIIKNATGYEYKISKGKVTFFLKPYM